MGECSEEIWKSHVSEVTHGCRMSMEINISILSVCLVLSIRDTAIPISRRL